MLFKQVVKSVEEVKPASLSVDALLDKIFNAGKASKKDESALEDALAGVTTCNIPNLNATLLKALLAVLPDSAVRRLSIGRAEGPDVNMCLALQLVVRSPHLSDIVLTNPKVGASEWGEFKDLCSQVRAHKGMKSCKVYGIGPAPIKKAEIQPLDDARIQGRYSFSRMPVDPSLSEDAQMAKRKALGAFFLPFFDAKPADTVSEAEVFVPNGKRKAPPSPS